MNEKSGRFMGPEKAETFLFVLRSERKYLKNPEEYEINAVSGRGVKLPEYGMISLYRTEGL